MLPRKVTLIACACFWKVELTRKPEAGCVTWKLSFPSLLRLFALVLKYAAALLLIHLRFICTYASLDVCTEFSNRIRPFIFALIIGGGWVFSHLHTNCSTVAQLSTLLPSLVALTVCVCFWRPELTRMPEIMCVTGRTVHKYFQKQPRE